MDDEGPLREEYLPRRRSKEALAPFYQEHQRSSAYGTPNGDLYSQDGQRQEYAPLGDLGSSIPAQTLGQSSMDTHATHALPPTINVNNDSGNVAAPFKADYVPSTTSLFTFPTSNSNPSTLYSTLPSFSFGFGDIDNTYTGGAPGLGHPNSNNIYSNPGTGHPRVASTLCDYFLSYSRVRVC